MPETGSGQGRLRGRGAIVTGGGTGIGRAVARRFAAEGARVVVCGRRPGPLAVVVSEINDRGGAALAVPTDVSRSPEVARLFATALEWLERLDVLVCCAGSAEPPSAAVTERLARQATEVQEHGRPLSALHATASLTDERWRAALAVNLDGTSYCCRAAAGIMEGQRRGRIITVASLTGIRGLGTHPDYSAAKDGIIALSKSLAQDLTPCGVAVNVIAPGLVETAMAAALPPGRRHMVTQQSLHGRAATPEEIAGTALFLASDDSGFLTGQVISPNGGVYM